MAFTEETRPTDAIDELARLTSVNVTLDTFLLGGIPDPITIFDGNQHNDHGDDKSPGVTSHTPAFVTQDLHPLDDTPKHTATGVATRVRMAGGGLQISLFKPGRAEVISLPAAPADVETEGATVITGATGLDVVVVEIVLVLGVMFSDEIELPELDLPLIHVLLDLLGGWSSSPGFVAKHSRSHGEGVDWFRHRIGDGTTWKGFHFLHCGTISCLGHGFSGLGDLLTGLLGAS